MCLLLILKGGSQQKISMYEQNTNFDFWNNNHAVNVNAVRAMLFLYMFSDF